MKPRELRRLRHPRRGLSSTILRSLLLLLSTAVGEIMAVDRRFSDLSTNVTMANVEAIIITTLITTARVDKRQIVVPLPEVCYENCSK